MIDRPTIEDIAYRSRWGQTDGHLTFTDFRHPGVLHVALEPLVVRVTLDGRAETAVGARREEVGKLKDLKKALLDRMFV